MIEVNDIVDHEDGSATVTITVDYDTLVNFARIGFLTALREAADKVIEQQEVKE